MQPVLAIFFLTIFLIPILVKSSQCLNISSYYQTELIDFMLEGEEESGENESKEKGKDAKEDADKLLFDAGYTNGQLLSNLISCAIFLQKKYNYKQEIPVPPPQSFQI
jgi:hypothetical protein